jgi:hypothetical protein
MSIDTIMQEHKVNNFIQDTKFTVNNNPKQHYQKAVKQVLKQLNNFKQYSKFTVNNYNTKQHYQKAVKQVLKQHNNGNNIIKETFIWRYKNMNTAPANLNATTELHTTNTTIRPNWKNALMRELVK